MFITSIFLKILKVIHTRIGRTGRAGKKGVAITFVNPIEMDYIRQVEQANKRQMTALRPPHRKEVLKARENDIKGKVQNWMSRDSEPRLQRIATELIEEYNDVNLVAALLQELVESNDDVDVQLTFEKPLSRGKGRQGKGGPKHSGGNHKRGGGKFDNKNRRSGKGGEPTTRRKMIDLLQTETTIRNHQSKVAHLLTIKNK